VLTRRFASLALPLSVLTFAALFPVIKASAQLIGPTPYLSSLDSPFNGPVFSYFFLENFEDGLLNVPGVTASAGSLIPPGEIPTR
jgi:hypothetical protein